jgi:hypothetical protein
MEEVEGVEGEGDNAPRQGRRMRPRPPPRAPQPASPCPPHVTRARPRARPPRCRRGQRSTPASRPSRRGRGSCSAGSRSTPRRGRLVWGNEAGGGVRGREGACARRLASACHARAAACSTGIPSRPMPGVPISGDTAIPLPCPAHLTCPLAACRGRSPRHRARQTRLCGPGWRRGVGWWCGVGGDSGACVALRRLLEEPAEGAAAPSLC